MAVQTHIKTYSLVDLKVATLTDEVVGTLIDVPGIRQLDLTLTTDQAELRGDNKVISVVDNGNGCEWKAEQGGLSMAALQVIFGLTYTDSGVTPNIVRTLEIKSSDHRPYFYIVGQAVGDDGVQDLHVQILKAKMTDNFEASLQDGEFLVPSFGGTAIGRTSDDAMVRILQNETSTAVAAPAA